MSVSEFGFLHINPLCRCELNISAQARTEKTERRIWAGGGEREREGGWVVRVRVGVSNATGGGEGGTGGAAEKGRRGWPLIWTIVPRDAMVEN